MASEATALLDKAESRLAARAYREAHALCVRALEAQPGSGRAWFLLGVLSADHNQMSKAAQLFERATAFDANEPRHHAHLSRALIALDRQSDALAAAERALNLGPEDALTLDTLGVAMTRLGHHERALDLFEKAVALTPDNASFLFNLAAARQFAGDFAGAEDSYARCLARDPSNHRAWSARVQLRRQTVEMNDKAVLENMFEDGALDADRALHLGHALAKTCEDLGDHAGALAWLRRAKAAKRADARYDPGFDAAVFAAAARTGGPTSPEGGCGNTEPIFIVGLPRSGTTLVDRILSSHSQVTSAGELSNFALLLKRATGTRSNLVMDVETLDASRNVDAGRLGADYIASTRPLTGATARFVDKMPLNVIYAGLIHRALPNARIICLRRHPLDVCLSNYRQLFATGFVYYNYALDLEDTARYYVGFDQLVSHWRAALPADRFTEIAYEDLIADQVTQTSRLLDFCGLDWEDACLAFHKNAAPVATASSVQARQPLYATSVGRWRRYGDALEPARAILANAGLLKQAS